MHHKLTEQEAFDQRNKSDLELMQRIFSILEDLEERLIIIENKSK